MDSLPRNSILVGDALERLQGLPTASVDCVMTSPPYYQLRDYGVDGQIGLEPTVQAWVMALRPVFAEVARVLRPSGAMWLDLGDTYSQRASHGAPIKSLLLAPERLTLALSRDGWIVRNKVVWAKSTPMPSGVLDRLESTYDTVHLLVRSRRYFFDLDAIREPHLPNGQTEDRGDLGKNPGDVWRLPTAKFNGAHFATFPPELVRRPLLATCPARVCIICGSPWRTRSTTRHVGKPVAFKRDPYIRLHPVRYRVIRRNPRLVPGCKCDAGTRPGIVLDPFFGTGTVGIVAKQHGRDWLGIELNPDYAELARRRIEAGRLPGAADVPKLGVAA